MSRIENKKEEESYAIPNVHFLFNKNTVLQTSSTKCKMYSVCEMPEQLKAIATKSVGSKNFGQVEWTNPSCLNLNWHSIQLAR